MNKERRLGRGLEALLGRRSQPQETQPAPQDSAIGPPPEDTRHGDFDRHETDPAAHDHQHQQEQHHHDHYNPHAGDQHLHAPMSVAGNTAEIDVATIESNPYQPRQEFGEEELNALSESIAAHGLLQPIVVRRLDDGRYQLIAGERRLRAIRKAGFTQVAVTIVQADERKTAELAIIENVQRKDLGPMEKAASFQNYLDRYGCTQEELAGRLNMDRSTVANFIRLLELPDAVQDSVRAGRITQGHARALLPLGEEEEQIAFCRRIERESMSVRETESGVREAIERADGGGLRLVGGHTEAQPARPTRNEHLAAMEQQLRAALGMKVKLTGGAGGRGKLTIQFTSHEEFERLKSLLMGDQSRQAMG